MRYYCRQEANRLHADIVMILNDCSLISSRKLDRYGRNLAERWRWERVTGVMSVTTVRVLVLGRFGQKMKKNSKRIELIKRLGFRRLESTLWRKMDSNRSTSRLSSTQTGTSSSGLINLLYYMRTMSPTCA